MVNELSIELAVRFSPWASLRPSMARRLGIALLLLTNAVDLAVVTLTGSVAGACAIGMSVLTACASIAAGSHVPRRTRIMAALAAPLNLQAIVIADHVDPDELLLISAARSCVLAVVAAMPLLYPPRLASDTAIADATVGACVLCLFLSLLGVVLPSLRDVREGTSANTLSADTTSLGAGGLGGNIMAHATWREGRTPPLRPRRLGGDAFRLLDRDGALPPRSRRTHLPQAGLHLHTNGWLRTQLGLGLHAAYACLSTASLLATPLHLGRWLGLASLLLLAAAQLSHRCGVEDAALTYAAWLVLPLSLLAGLYRACTSCALLAGLGLLLLAALARAAAAATAAADAADAAAAADAADARVQSSAFIRALNSDANDTTVAADAVAQALDRSRLRRRRLRVRLLLGAPLLVLAAATDLRPHDASYLCYRRLVLATQAILPLPLPLAPSP